MNEPTEKTKTTAASTGIDLATMSCTADIFGQLSIRDDLGNAHTQVIPIRLFPISRPDAWISLVDFGNRELICLENLDSLNAASREAIQGALSHREFVPIVTKIVWVSGNSEPCEWQVETDRGTTRFVLKHENDVRRLGDNGVLIVDSHGIRYFIRDRNRVDKFTRRIIEWYV